MTTLRLVLGDQLSRGLSALADLGAADVVLMAEVAQETTYAPHHKQKLALVLSAMRRFAEGLRGEGVAVDYVTLDAPGNSGALAGAVERARARHGAARVIATEPGEWRVEAASSSRATCAGASACLWRAASPPAGAYIHRMSDYCAGCAYDPKLKSGPKACPFNPLYWDFLLRNRAKLSKNPRMAMPYRTLGQMSEARIAEIRADAAAILESEEFSSRASTT
jgi:deoxyribodipyrimidine photolyase-like uncharacterized protein